MGNKMLIDISPKKAHGWQVSTFFLIKIKKNDHIKCWQGCGEEVELSHTVVGMQNDAAGESS